MCRRCLGCCFGGSPKVPGRAYMWWMRHTWLQIWIAWTECGNKETRLVNSPGEPTVRPPSTETVVDGFCWSLRFSSVILGGELEKAGSSGPGHVGPIGREWDDGCLLLNHGQQQTDEVSSEHVMVQVSRTRDAILRTEGTVFRVRRDATPRDRPLMGR